jgi:hypothetical protein
LSFFSLFFRSSFSLSFNAHTHTYAIGRHYISHTVEAAAVSTFRVEAKNSTKCAVENRRSTVAAQWLFSRAFFRQLVTPYALEQRT